MEHTEKGSTSGNEITKSMRKASNTIIIKLQARVPFQHSFADFPPPNPTTSCHLRTAPSARHSTYSSRNFPGVCWSHRRLPVSDSARAGRGLRGHHRDQEAVRLQTDWGAGKFSNEKFHLKTGRARISTHGLLDSMLRDLGVTRKVWYNFCAVCYLQAVRGSNTINITHSYKR